MAAETTCIGARPWSSLYEPRVAGAVIPENGDMLSCFRAAVARNPAGIALRYFEETWTYAQLDERSDALGAWMNDRGVASGDRVTVILQNVPAFVLLAIAVWKLNATPVPTNPMYRGEELARILSDAAPKMVLCDARQAGVVAEALALARIAAIVLHTDSAGGQATLAPAIFGPEAEPLAGSYRLESILGDNAGRRPPEVAAAGSDLGLLMYTSGTTGRPKGAMLSHANLAFNARVTTTWMDHDPQSIILAVAPFFHITGFVSHLASAIDAASTMLLPFRMVPEIVLDLVRTYRPTHTVAAITAFNALMGVPGVGPDDFASLKRVYSGGAPIPPSLRDRIREKLGIDIYPGFGMTETAAPTHYAPFGLRVPVDEASGALAIGVPVFKTDAIIADDEGREVKPGVAGELLLRGPQIMSGYRHLADESAATLAGGWMHSGDIAVMDAEGWFYIVDRKKDVIIASGFKVWPREVEDCLYTHEAVREAAVIGIADAYRGETVKAFVSLRADAQTSANELQEYCRDRLAGYKCPRIIELLPELPKTITGKIQRNVLRGS